MGGNEVRLRRHPRSLGELDVAAARIYQQDERTGSQDIFFKAMEKQRRERGSENGEAGAANGKGIRKAGWVAQLAQLNRQERDQKRKRENEKRENEKRERLEASGVSRAGAPRASLSPRLPSPRGGATRPHPPIQLSPPSPRGGATSEAAVSMTDTGPAF